MIGDGYFSWRLELRGAAAAALLCLLVSCSGDDSKTRTAVLVNLVTDLVPGQEFTVARVELFQEPPEPMAASPSTRVDSTAQGRVASVEPVRVAAYEGLSADDYYVRLRLLGSAGEALIERVAIIAADGVVSTTLTLTRNCVGVECPLEGAAPHLIACLDGMCVDPRCTPEAPETCPVPTCTDDGACTAVATDCADGACSGGVCLQVERVGACEPVAWCHPDDGCAPRREPPLDGGIIGDGGTDGDVGVDGGLECPTGFGDCTAAPGCETALGTSADCGGCGTACAVDQRCVSAVCTGMGAYREDRTVGALDADVLRGVTVAPDGRIYAVGEFTGTADFGGGARSITGFANSAFVVAYEDDFTYRWDRVWSVPASSVVPLGVGVDGAGNVYVAGHFGGPLDFGGGVRDDVGSLDGYLVALDSNGAHLWDRQLGGPGFDECVGLDVGEARVCVSLAFEPGADLGGGVVASAGGEDVAVACYSTAGVFDWAATFGSTGDERPEALAMDGDGNVYVGGFFSSPIDFGGGARVPAFVDGFVASFGPTGAYRWDRVVGGSGIDAVYGVAASPTGPVVLTGRFEGPVNFGGGPRTAPPGVKNAFAIALERSGAFRYDYQLASGGDALIRAVAVEPDGRVYVAGSFAAIATLDGPVVFASGVSDAFVMDLGTTGVPQWSQVWSGSGTVEPFVAATGGSGLWVGGRFDSNTDFGAGVRTNAGDWDAFLVQVAR